MFLIADSGSTKCDWVLFKSNEKEPIRFRTKGLNPSILKREALQQIISENETLLSFSNEITSIYFFGAGCNTQNSIQLIEDILSTFFTNATFIVKEDTMAAIWATTNKPAVLCILGTGSNCCFYDGKNIQSKTPSMGYLLMDEASGNYYGKELLKSYYYNQMPNELKVAFENDFLLNVNDVINNLYQSETPNKYLAEFAVFLFKYKEHDLMDRIIREGIAKFIDNQLLQFREELKTLPLYFVGSIAYYAQDYINSALKEKGIKVSGFIKRPIENVILKIKAENILV
ncbi:N-acetylglucosamine kinase [Lutibacter flavus]|uniref:BadF-type ATPase n=1 Tax=Lutibacter flavus TaxID=691689 RepID=A0A238YU43_9FLAO|nr:N-acetylglucosamine kinase [Lutibacter flavus]SNR74665.1 BadF-type ATPase [Lutibacter flavus]